MRNLLVMMLMLAFLSPALAVQPDEILKDPALEQRARSISAGLRCLVCQNQSIDESDASVARDLRILIREQLQQGRSDVEVVDFVVARFGEFVLLKPRLEGTTIILWGAPFVILGFALFMALRKRAAPVASPLSETEKAEIAALLGDENAGTANPPQT